MDQQYKVLDNGNNRNRFKIKPKKIIQLIKIDTFEKYTIFKLGKKVKLIKVCFHI